jgi:hypothetical protein
MGGVQIGLVSLPSPPRLFAPLPLAPLPQLFTLLGVHEFLPSKRIVQLLEGQICYLQPHLCLNILAAIAGFNGGHVNATKLPLYVQHTPAGTSVQNMAHWAQVREQDKVNKGREEGHGGGGGAFGCVEWAERISHF